MNTVTPSRYRWELGLPTGGIGAFCLRRDSHRASRTEPHNSSSAGQFCSGDFLETYWEIGVSVIAPCAGTVRFCLGFGEEQHFSQWPRRDW